MQIGNHLVKVDQIADYIPGISTAMSLVNIVQKAVIMPFLKDDTIANSHYYTHLNQKSFSRCIALLVPVLGNIAVGIYDLVNINSNVGQDVSEGGDTHHLSSEDSGKSSLSFSNGSVLKHSNRNFNAVLDAIEKNGTSALKDADNSLKNNADFMKEVAGKHNQWVNNNKEAISKGDLNHWEIALRDILNYASDELKSNEKFMLFIIRRYQFRTDTFPLVYASDDLKNNEQFILEVIQWNKVLQSSNFEKALPYIGKKLMDSPEFVKNVLKEDFYKDILKYVTEEVRQAVTTDEQFIKDLWNKYKSIDVFKHADEKLTNDITFMKFFIKQDYKVISYFGTNLANNEEVMREMIGEYGMFAFIQASEEVQNCVINDKPFMKKILEKDQVFFKLISPEFLNELSYDAEFIKKMINCHKVHVLQHFCYKDKGKDVLKLNNEEFAKEMLEQDLEVRWYLIKDILVTISSDKEFIEKLKQIHKCTQIDFVNGMFSS